MKKVWFITGSSRGLGRSLTKAVLAAGDLLAATSRNPDDLRELKQAYADQILVLTLDVTDKAAIRLAVERTISHFGRIDVLVNNAGFGVTGATEAFTEDQVQSQLEVNLYAPIAITRAVLPYMRKQRSGRILQISSIGGRVGNAGLSIYQAAKFGLQGFSEALSKEVAPLGIKVTSVEPGGFRTDWAGNSMSFAPEVEGYESSIGAIRAFLTSGKFVAVGDPEKAARVMLELAENPAPPVHLVLGSEAAAILKSADEQRKAEFEKWFPVSISTDHDESQIFAGSDAAKAFLGIKGIRV